MRNKAFTIRHYKAAVVECTKEANTETRQDCIKRTTDRQFELSSTRRREPYLTGAVDAQFLLHTKQNNCCVGFNKKCPLL